MDYYENKQPGSRLHTVCIGFQYGEFKGKIAYKVGGNRRGIALLEFDPDVMDSKNISRFVENDCEFAFNEETESFSLSLTDTEGSVAVFADLDGVDVGCMVVSAEIIDCQKGH